MTNRDWKTLIRSIDQGDCVLLLGPEIATEEVDGVQKTLGAILANELAETEEIKDRVEIVDRDNLAHVGQKYMAAVSKYDLQLATADFYKDRNTPALSIHSDLASLPFRLIVKATPDHLLAKAYADLAKAYVDDYYNYRGEKKNIAPIGSRDKPLIYYLYGSIHKPKSLVITENDLLDFLVAIISQNPPLPTNILSEFRNKDRSFLFLGFGFKQWYLRILLYVLQEGQHNSRSFAFEEIESFDDVSLQCTIIFYRETFRLGVYPIKPELFVKELRQRFEAQAAETPPPDPTTPVLPEDAPTAFLCHANQDKAYAQQLADTLRQRGIDPWLDEDALEGGDLWNQRIRTAINEVDYFVVLQSKAMAQKTVGYLNREIHLAADRQMEFRFGTNFIIPVQIEPCTRLEELSHLLTIDLTAEDGLDNLVRVMKRDFERRRKQNPVPGTP